MIKGKNLKKAVEELDVQIGTKKQQKLVQIKERCEDELINGEIEAMINKNIIELLEREIRAEREKKSEDLNS